MTWLPPWVRHYQSSDLAGDIAAGVVVALLLVPQGLAYALLAGLPLEVGLYASLAPLVVYALLGTSRQQSVGPMAVTALMTGAALAPLASAGSAHYVALAMGLAILSGAMLFVFGWLRMGWLAQYLSQPVLVGFTAASAVLIALSQLPVLLGVPVTGRGLLALWQALSQHTWLPTFEMALGLAAMVWLWLSRRFGARALKKCGVPAALADILAKLLPAALVIVSTAFSATFHWDTQSHVTVVGAVPAGLPQPVWPSSLTITDWQSLLLPALLLGLINFVQSIAVAQTLAQKARESIDPDRELVALGAANLAAGVSGGMPVTGGLTRSAVNAAAGARTQLASVLTAGWMVLILLWGTDALYALPQTVLAATIIMSVLTMIDLAEMRRIMAYDYADGAAMWATAAVVMVGGVQAGVLAGIALSLGFLVWRMSHPHIAVVGRMPGSEHFRNVRRHAVQTEARVVLLRVDESFCFANIRPIETALYQELSQHPDAQDVVLLMSAVNRIDATAFERLFVWQDTLAVRGIRLHLAEVKGPVMDRLSAARQWQQFQGKVFLSAHDAACFFSASPSVSPPVSGM